jgi:hypothetical protein
MPASCNIAGRPGNKQIAARLNRYYIPGVIKCHTSLQFAAWPDIPAQLDKTFFVVKDSSYIIFNAKTGKSPKACRLLNYLHKNDAGILIDNISV